MDESKQWSAQDVAHEIRRLSDLAGRASTLEELRSLFYEGDNLAKTYPQDDAIQELRAQLKQIVAERGNAIQTGFVPVHTDQDDPFGGSDSAPAEPLDATFPGLSVPPPGWDVGTAVRTPSDEMQASGTEQTPPPSAVSPTMPTVAGVPFPPSPAGTRVGRPGSGGPFGTMAGRTTGGQRVRTPSGPLAASGKKPSSKLPFVVVGVALVGILLLGFLAVHFGGQYLGLGGQTPPGMVAVNFSTTPSGAPIRVDHQLRCNSDCRVDLEPGEHKLEIIVDGYEPHIESIFVEEGSPADVRVSLTPRPQTVRFFADMASGTVILDGQPAGSIQEGQLILDNVAPGDHEVTVRGGPSEMTFSFRLAPGQAPEITSPIQANNVLGVVFSNSGAEAFARSSTTPLRVAVDGVDAGEIGPDGLKLTGLEPGNREVRLGVGGSQQKLVVQFGAAPTLTAFLKLDVNAGTLVVVTDESDVQVLLNGRAQRRLTRDGILRIVGLPVSEYTVAVAKEGYEGAEPQRVAVRKGEESRVEFALKPIAKMAALRLSGGLAGTQVLLGSSSIGAIQSDGSFANSAIPPGSHTIELRRDKYQPKRIQKRFNAGETVELTAVDVAMERMPGAVRLRLSPPNSTVTVRRADQREGRVVTDNPLTLPEGQWTITASAANHTERSSTLSIQPGETVTVDLSLARAAVVEDKPKAGGMELWAQADTWVSEGQWLVKRGGDLVPYQVRPANGTFVFTATMLRGRRLMWVVNMTNPRNYVLMEMDRNEYKRKVVTDGRSKELEKKRHGLGDTNVYTISVDIRPNRLTQRIYKGGTWEELDTWEDPGMNLSQGTFGFNIPGNDRLGISNFAFTPR